MKTCETIMILALLSLIFSCRKENKCTTVTNPKCNNYNPCYSVHSLSADFSIYENDCTVGPGQNDTSWHYYPTDTIYTNCATFTASDSTADSVRWTIGAGSYTARSFQLNFTGQRSQPIPIRLTVYKHRNSCYPTDDTVKTLTKTLYFTDSCYALNTYSGYYDNNPLDTGTISIKTVLIPASGTLKAVPILIGFIPGCSDTLFSGGVEYFYTCIYFDGYSGSCPLAEGSLYYNRFNNTVLVQYKTVVTNPPSNTIIHNFNGLKIN